MLFHVDMGYGTSKLCPVCMRQSAEASLLEAEAMGMAVPLLERPLADDMASPENLVQQAREALLGTLIDVCSKHGVGLKELLANPLVAAELGIAPPSSAGTEEVPRAGPSMRQRLIQERANMNKGIFGDGQ